jgi:hypothetical protein
MVSEYVIEPLVGVGPVKFGSTKADVTATLGTPERIIRGKRLLYFGSALQVHVDEHDSVRFIEVGLSGAIRPTMDGVAMLEVRADEAMGALMRRGAIDRSHPECPRVCIAPRVEVSLWRSSLPHENPEGGGRFESVGCGRAGYFSKGDLQEAVGVTAR